MGRAYVHRPGRRRRLCRPGGVIEFGKHSRTIGFDLATNKVESCLREVDPSREIPDEDMAAAKHALYSDHPQGAEMPTSSPGPCPRRWMRRTFQILGRSLAPVGRPAGTGRRVAASAARCVEQRRAKLFRMLAWQRALGTLSTHTHPAEAHLAISAEPQPAP